MHGLGPHNITVGGQGHHRAPGAPGVLQRHRGGQGGHLRPLGAAAAGGQGRARQGDGAHHVHHLSWPPCSAPSASASDEAHGKGVALQLNHFLDTGAVKVNPDGTFAVVPEKIQESVTALTKQLMELQGRGDRAAGRGPAGEAGRGPPRGAEGARQAQERARGHRAPLRHRRPAPAPVSEPPRRRRSSRRSLPGPPPVLFRARRAAQATTLWHEHPRPPRPLGRPPRADPHRRVGRAPRVGAHGGRPLVGLSRRLAPHRAPGPPVHRPLHHRP